MSDRARHILSPRQLFDLELLLDGAFVPLRSFMGHDDYISVLETMRLSDGRLWPMPIMLDLPYDAVPRLGTMLELCDTSGRVIASMRIDEVFDAQKRREALSVYGTDDMMHPGVRYLFEQTHALYVSGPVRRVARAPKPDFHNLRMTPSGVRAALRARGWDTVVAFQTRNPLHRAHYEILARAAKETGNHILIHPVVGITKDGDIDYIARTRSYVRLVEKRFGSQAILALLPLAMRMAGPREALWHALIRKNYGATHFVIGRDHAGPGNDASGTPFYPPYAAQELARSYERDLGISIITTSELVYVENEDRYLPTDELLPHHVVKSISGTEFRRMLHSGEEIPSWFSFPEVIEELRLSFDTVPVSIRERSRFK